MKILNVIPGGAWRVS